MKYRFPVFISQLRLADGKIGKPWAGIGAALFLLAFIATETLAIARAIFH